MECYIVIANATRLSHKRETESEFSLFTDHCNLVFIPSPARFNCNVACDVASKVHRWTLRLSELNFVPEHVGGEANNWAELMTRWGAPSAGGHIPSSAVHTAALRVPLLSKDPPDLPSVDVFGTSQAVYPDPSSGTVIVMMVFGEIWQVLCLFHVKRKSYIYGSMFPHSAVCKSIAVAIEQYILSGKQFIGIPSTLKHTPFVRIVYFVLFYLQGRMFHTRWGVKSTIQDWANWSISISIAATSWKWTRLYLYDPGWFFQIRLFATIQVGHCYKHSRCCYGVSLDFFTSS